MFENIKNVSELLQKQAEAYPDKVSIVCSKQGLFGNFKYPSYDFKTANARVNAFCHTLTASGVVKGDKVLFFVKPNLDYALIAFAMFRMGAIPVFIDPGMKKEYFFQSIAEVKPRVLIGIPKAILISKIFREKFKSVEVTISTAKYSLLGRSLYKGFDEKLAFDMVIPSAEDLAAILYTSGGTGKPKGVEYTHSIFINQTKMLKEEFNLTKDDIDIPGFPLFSFFTLAMGMKSVIPMIDFSQPIKCDSAKVVRNILDNSATFLAGSPAIWDRIADYCLQNNMKLTSVKYLVMFGAPVSISLHKKLVSILPNGTTYTPYGATECLPLTNISGEYILKNTAHLTLKGLGVCVGHPLSGVKVKVISTQANSETAIDLKQTLPANSIGEIVVTSANVTKAYYENDEATNKSKIFFEGSTWHRMGDVGYLDDDGKLWFCGRKKHVVAVNDKYYYPAQIESVFNQHPKISKSALVFNSKSKRPALIIKRKDGRDVIESMFLMDLKGIAQTNPLTSDIHQFYVENNFPVDIRHNIKIDRTKLQKDVLGA